MAPAPRHLEQHAGGLECGRNDANALGKPHGTILTLTGNHDKESFCQTLRHAMSLASPVPGRPDEPKAPPADKDKAAPKPAAAGRFRAQEIDRSLKVGYAVVVADVNGREQTLVATEGDCIGELAGTGPILQTASLRARGEVHLFVIDDSRFQALVRQHPEVSIHVIKFLAQRLGESGG